MTLRKYIESTQNKRFVIICVAVFIGVIIMPHDDPVATIVTKYIFPAVVSGVCFGIAMMEAINMMRAKASMDKDSTKGE